MRVAGASVPMELVVVGDEGDPDGAVLVVVVVEGREDRRGHTTTYVANLC